MKTLLLTLMLTILLGFNVVAAAEEINGNKPLDQCPDQDVWVYVKHTADTISHRDCTVVVHIPKQTLVADFQNCPATDIKLVGKGRVGSSDFAGFHVVTMKKGHLNDPKNFTTKAPKHIKVPANNGDTWHVGIIRDY